MTSGIHHVAFACLDPEATHRFYSEVLGFPLVHTELSQFGKGWFRHFFYDVGNDSSIAFFELHDVGEPTPQKTAISTDLGYPIWVNHVAFRVDRETQQRLAAKARDAQLKVVLEHDHGWCHSVYLRDPNGILVELCADHEGGMPVDLAEAERLRTVIPAWLASSP
ncbi:VOC family protein [Nannocystis punicea]|uniref:VOC family protein n=1 Tax=Nannocystis punicea TaxID=2995304 RepID=A0ABY7GSX8_9BACT|nr:VOC family protein [Nannocystis poenicansa]WAS90060.1 VOC family protein [Nannocystis poenicansa]